MNLITAFPRLAGRFKRTLCVLAVFGAFLPVTPLSASRIKDLTQLDGGRDNQLVGYGLIVGLAGDGDSNALSTLRSVSNTLSRYGISVDSTQIKAKNVAAVMVTADIGAFLKPGSRIDVTVASMGDAKTLQGGVLLQTPLLGADGRVYAVAQGPVAIGGFLGGTGGPGGATVQKNHPRLVRSAMERSSSVRLPHRISTTDRSRFSCATLISLRPPDSPAPSIPCGQALPALAMRPQSMSACPLLFRGARSPLSPIWDSWK